MYGVAWSYAAAQANGGRYLHSGSASAGNGIAPNVLRGGVRGQVHSGRNIAGHIEVGRVGDILHEENAKACADHGFVTQRIGDANPRSEALILCLHQVVVQAAAADRIGAGPMDAQAFVWVRAAALPDKEWPIGLRSIRRRDELRDLHCEVVAQCIGKGRS